MNTVQTGAIFIKENALLPESLRFEAAPYSKGWRQVRNLEAGGLDRKIRAAAWTFFFMAGEIRSSVFGFDREAAASKAVRKILAKRNVDKCNSLEIARVTAKRFLGLPYVTVSAHARHIQDGIFLFQAPRRPAAATRVLGAAA